MIRDHLPRPIYYLRFCTTRGLRFMKFSCSSHGPINCHRAVRSSSKFYWPPRPHYTKCCDITNVASLPRTRLLGQSRSMGARSRRSSCSPVPHVPKGYDAPPSWHPLPMMRADSCIEPASTTPVTIQLRFALSCGASSSGSRNSGEALKPAARLHNICSWL
jgi:hypothetical protein